MKTEQTDRRREARWVASSNKYQAHVRFADGSECDATIVDISPSGIGLRIRRCRFQAGMHARIKIEMAGESIEVKGVLRFVDRFFPRVGLQVEPDGAMAALLRHVEREAFMIAEITGDTMFVKGAVTLAAREAFHAARGLQKIDLTGVGAISLGGAHHLLKLTQSGVRIAGCSAAVAPRLGSLGICDGARYCVAAVPCDLPKRWPMRADFIARNAAPTECAEYSG